MKKLILVFFAALSAVGLSSFTSNNYGDVFYKNASDQLVETTATPCTEGSIPDCERAIPELLGTVKQLYHANGVPYTRNQ